MFGRLVYGLPHISVDSHQFSIQINVCINIRHTGCSGTVGKTVEYMF